MRVPPDVVEAIAAEVRRPVATADQRLHQHYRLGLCKALELVGAPDVELENTILREIAEASARRARLG